MTELNKTIKKSYIELNNDEVNSLIKELDESQFRAQQIQNWVFDHHVETWDEMENLPIHIREELSARLPLHPLEINHIQILKMHQLKKFFFKPKMGIPLNRYLCMIKNGQQFVSPARLVVRWIVNFALRPAWALSIILVQEKWLIK